MDTLQRLTNYGIATFAVASLVVGLIAECGLGQELTADIKLDRSNYEAWRDHLRPSESELAFYRIPWQRTFSDGILKADQLQKPLLLWAMNGHPLGCT